MKTRSVAPDDPTFPPALGGSPGPKPTPCEKLYVRGGWPPPPGIAIVGTREPTREALAFTRELAASVVDAGWAVWSGGAFGIDAAAHEAAMERGGRTVLVSPSGFEAPYPKEHAKLFERICATGGTLVTLFEDDARPLLASFHRRNALLAALTLATVVVQAGEKSGARSTANAARRLGKPLFVVPHAPWSEQGRGCALELEIGNGSRALATNDALLAHLGDRELRLRPSEPAAKRKGSPERSGAKAARDDDRQGLLAYARERDHARVLHALQTVSEDAVRVFQAIPQTPIHADDLCERTSLPFATVTAALLTLTLQAVVVEAPAGYYRRKVN